MKNQCGARELAPKSHGVIRSKAVVTCCLRTRSETLLLDFPSENCLVLLIFAEPERGRLARLSLKLGRMSGHQIREHFFLGVGTTFVSLLSAAADVSWLSSQRSKFRHPLRCNFSRGFEL